MTHLARTSIASAVLAALRGAGLSGVFLVRETAPGKVELVHDARRESTLHMRTDLYEARLALERAGFDPFEVGASILVDIAPVADLRPPLAKALPNREELDAPADDDARVVDTNSTRVA